MTTSSTAWLARGVGSTLPFVPETAYNPGRPSVYVDWSHLSDAHRSMAEAEYAECKPLLEVVLEVSAAPNLCLSSVHLMELMGRPNPHRDAMALWLDGLQFVWVESTGERLEHKEAENALLRQLGAPVVRYSPFARIFPAIRDPKILDFVREVESHGGPAWLRQISRDSAASMNRDRKRSQREGLSDAEVRAHLEVKTRVGIGKLLSEAHADLRLRDGYRAASVHPPTDDEFAQACSAVIGDESRLPGFRAGVHVTREFSFAIRNQNPDSKNFKSHESSVSDHNHCVTGGAYCDVFTCDSRTFIQLGDYRSRIGKRPQLSTSECGGPAGLAEAIRVQLKELSTNGK